MSTARRGLSLLAMVALLAACTGPDQPEPGPSETIPPIEQAFRELPEPADPVTAAQAGDYTGIGQLHLSGQCTATLLETGVDDAPAYVLTNGHCAAGWGHDGNLVLVDDDEQVFAAYVAFGLVAGQDAGPRIDVAAIAYSTMLREDVAVLELDSTLGEARAAGLAPVPLAADAPDPGQAVVNVGIPVRELGQDDWVQRRGQCTLGQQVDLLENVWYWQGSWANDCPGIIQGSSGSPLLADDGSIVAVINTTTYGGFVRGGECFLSNPCELTDDGIAQVADRSYAAPVDAVAACFGADGRFALDDACPLPRPGLTTFTGRPTVSLDAVRDGSVVDVQVLSDEATTARWGVAAASSARPCAQESTYTDRVAVEAADTAGTGLVQPTTLSVELPAVEGRSLVCLTTDDPDDAAVAVLDVDGTPPVFTPTVSVEDVGDGVWVIPSFVNPELSDISTTYGPVGSVDCEDTDAFDPFRSVPISIAHGDLPVTFCLLARDTAGNAAPVQSFTVRG